MAHRLVVDFLGAIGVTDAGNQIAERETLLHLRGRHAEGGGDVVHRAAFLDEAHEGFVFAHGIGIAPGGVFQQARLRWLRHRRLRP